MQPPIMVEVLSRDGEWWSFTPAEWRRLAVFARVLGTTPEGLLRGPELPRHARRWLGDVDGDTDGTEPVLEAVAE